MATVEWTGERLNDSFEALRDDIRELRAEVRQVWVTMMGGYAVIVATLIATRL